MRWKLLVIISIVATLLAIALWCAAVIVFFGPARIVNLNWLWPISFAIPLAVSVTAGFFVYRHTSRRRKFQAAVVTLVVIILTALGYFVAAQLLPLYLDFAHQPPSVATTR